MVTRRAQVWLTVLVWVATVGTVGACDRSAHTENVHLTPCRIGSPAVQAKCGLIEVSEDRSLPESRRFEVHFAVLPAMGAAASSSPLLILVGGPGQAAMTSGVPIAQLLAEVRREHDVVLVDQRGTGRSHPLRCPEEDLSLSARFSHVPSGQDIERCLRSLDADTTQYTTLAAIADLEDVRSALGYRQWNLWGGSYGTRVALAYAQLHPTSINRMVLDGVAPPDLKLPLHFASDAQASLDALQSDCTNVPECREAFRPVTTVVQSLLDKLGADGIEVRVSHPSRGTSENVHMSRDGFLGGVRTLLYSADLSALLPYALHEAQLHDNWAPFVTSVAVLTDLASEPMTHLGMYLSVVCAEDVPRITDEEMTAHTKGTLFGSSLVEQARSWCKHWTAAKVPERFFEPVATEHPTLVLSGRRDPATPPRWGTLVAERLENSLHVTVASASHGVTPVGCAHQIIDNFLSASDALGTKTACLAEATATPFFSRVTGP